jgi:hypothetical protein
MEDFSAADISAAIQQLQRDIDDAVYWSQSSGPDSRDFSTVYNELGLTSDSVRTETFQDPITKGRKGFMYDINKISDTRRKNRVIQNRDSAKKSKEKKKMQVAREDAKLAHLMCENDCLKHIQDCLQQKVIEAEVIDSLTWLPAYMFSCDM